MITDISSIQFKFFIEGNMYHIQLRTEYWTLKVYFVPWKPCSKSNVYTIVESFVTGGIMKWTRRSESWRKQHTSSGRTFMGGIWQISLRWWCILCGGHSIQSDAKWPLPVKWTVLSGNQRCHIFAYNQPRSPIFACISMFIVINDQIGTFFSLILGI